ncbi:MAG TPA: glycosyltransferase [Roseateles sp.]|uniref:glycosyltransferase n=1 Tax=Roseateles sp. TaxID=1971397 RepID=UPI002EDA6CEC
MSAPRPLVHVVAGLGAGGAETFLLRLLRADPRLREASRIVSIRPLDALSAQFEALGVPVLKLPLAANLRLPGHLLALRRTLADKDTRLIQSWLYLSDTLAAVLGAGKPVVWGIRSSHGARGKRLTGLLARRVNPWLSSRGPATIVCCGQQALEAHRALGYATERLHLIPNGYEIDRFEPDPAAGAALRAELGLAPDAFVVGMAARTDIYKDHGTLLQAVALARKQLPNLHLLLCGKGTDEEPIAALIRHHGLEGVCLPLGLQGDMRRFYAALDLHVLSSRSEGFPNVVAEASLYGCGSLSTDVGDARALLADPASLIPPGDASTMCERILAFQALPPAGRAQQIAANRAVVASQFDMNRIAQLYRATYEALAPGLLGGQT